MKINYKYSRNNAQFLYDLSCTSTIDQFIRRLTGRQIVTNDDGKKEHVDPAFNVDEVLIENVEVFNRAEHETVYKNIDKLCAPWDNTENKELSEEDAKRRNADLAKAAALLKTYNDRFVELDKYLSLLPAEVRKIPNEFMSIGVNGFYRTVSISLGLDEYLNEISIDKEAVKLFDTTEEKNQALTNVRNLKDFLDKLNESSQELFNSDDVKQKAPTGDHQETNDGQQDTSTGDHQEADKGQQNASTGDHQETDEGQQKASIGIGDHQETDDKGQQDTSTGDHPETDKGQQKAPTGDTEETPTGDQNETSEGQQKAPNGDDEETPTGGQNETSEGQQKASNGDDKGTSTDAGQQDTPTGSQQKTDEGQQKALNGSTDLETQLLPNLNSFLNAAND